MIKYQFLFPTWKKTKNCWQDIKWLSQSTPKLCFKLHFRPLSWAAHNALATDIRYVQFRIPYLHHVWCLCFSKSILSFLFPLHLYFYNCSYYCLAYYSYSCNCVWSSNRNSHDEYVSDFPQITSVAPSSSPKTSHYLGEFLRDELHLIMHADLSGLVHFFYTWMPYFLISHFFLS